MSVYMTEEEQLEVIKKWWQRYSNPILIGVSLILLGISGYRYWMWHEQKIVDQASNTYEHLMAAFSNQDNKAVRAYSNELIHTYGKTVYSDAAKLTLAKVWVNKEQYDKAREMLADVGAHARHPVLKQIAKIRLSRVLIAQKKYNEALAEIGVVEDVAYLPVINEIKGDIFAATAKYQQAILSYKKAIDESKNHGIGNLFLEMKTSEMATLAKTVMNPNDAIQAA